MSHTRKLPFALALFVLTLAPLSTAAAQDVTYRTRSSISMGATMDRVMSVAARLGGGSMDTEEVQYIKGRRTRTDVSESSSIIDLERGRMVALNHQARTYTDISFDSIRAMSEQMVQSMRQGGAQPAQQQQPQQQQESDVEYTFDVKVDRTGERERIIGYDAERVLVMVTVDARKKAAPPEEPGARFVVLTDLWTSRSVPGQDALLAIQREHAEQMTSEEMVNALSSAMAGDPGQRAAFQRAGEELKKIEGKAMRSTTYMVVGTTDKAIDQQAVLAPPQAQGGGAGASVRDAARGAVGGLLGRGRNNNPPPEPAPAPEPTQATLFKFIQELVEVSTSPIAESMFEIPAGYRRAGG